MALIGVRELKEQASKVIRQVREERAEYVITYKGKPVAVILPLDTEQAEAAMVQSAKAAVVGSSWEEYERLAQEIREAWPAGLSTQDVIDDIRR
jgi:prevent-host-death family protein